MTQGNRRRPSMADVGRVANVSAQTVSRLYTGGYVSDESRQRIEAAVRQLGYHPNSLPRSLRSGRTRMIGFLSMGPLNFGNAQILTGTGRMAHLEGQMLMTVQVDVDEVDPTTRAEIVRVLDNFMSMRVDGVIVTTPYIGIYPVLEYIGDAVPVVSLSEGAGPELDSIHVDSYGAARLAMDHLIELGHQRILHLAGPVNRNEATARVQGYLDGIADAGLDALPVMHSAEWDAASGERHAATADPQQFTAVFAANDEIALGFVSGLRRRGLEPPRDYSITGIDDMPEARYFWPPLTSVRLDFEQLGNLAMRRILDRIEGLEMAAAGSLPGLLVVRESTGVPPRGA